MRILGLDQQIRARLDRYGDARSRFPKRLWIAALALSGPSRVDAIGVERANQTVEVLGVLARTGEPQARSINNEASLAARSSSATTGCAPMGKSSSSLRASVAPHFRKILMRRASPESTSCTIIFPAGSAAKDSTTTSTSLRDRMLESGPLWPGRPSGRNRAGRCAPTF